MFVSCVWWHFDINLHCVFVCFFVFFAWHQRVQWWSEFQGTLLSFKWAPWRQQHATLWRFTLWGTWLRVQPRQLNSLRVSVPGSSVFSFRNCLFKLHTKAFWGNNTYIHFYICVFTCACMKHTWNPRREGINNLSSVSLLDVDAPYDLAASNILIESGLLAWKPPRADITGYILSFESTDGTVRVSIAQEPCGIGPGRSEVFRIWLCLQSGVFQWFLSQEVVLSPSAVSYNMAQLSASTEYSVKLQAIAGPKRSRVITTVFTTGEWTPFCYRDGMISLFWSYI